jgi:aryl-alcohol dehydrogenase-like predicted oxidoreductase
LIRRVEAKMELRPLGRTGRRVSALGFGAWGIGGQMWIGARDAESLRALHRAADLGVNLFDTALVYGSGHSEQLVGRFVRERREEVLVATKVPPLDRVWPARAATPVTQVFPAAHVRASVEASLRHLGLERIDLLQLHVWRDEWLDQGDWREAIEELKRAGQVRSFGVSINDHQPESALRLVASGLADAVQVIYNIYDPTPAAQLFPACLAHGVGVLARVPLDEGALTGAITPDTVFPEGDFRNRYFRGERRREVQARAEALRALLGPEAATLPELALRFCLSQDAVSTVIPGMRSVARVEDNARCGDGRRLSPELLRALAGHAWSKNFYA